MRFTLIDRIVELLPGERITAIKNLSLSEEYLGDHFPLFPVMPGVLMLEAMTQASAWLIRASEDFAHSIVVLKEARNVKYSDFVRPGGQLRVTAEMIKQTESETTLKAQGLVDDKINVSARLVLARRNETEDSGAMDAVCRRSMLELYGLLGGPQAVAASETVSAAD